MYGFFCGTKTFWNWFDFLVTMSGVASLFCDLLAGSSAIRIFRILRLAGHTTNLNQGTPKQTNVKYGQAPRVGIPLFLLL